MEDLPLQLAREQIDEIEMCVQLGRDGGKRMGRGFFQSPEPLHSLSKVKA